MESEEIEIDSFLIKVKQLWKAGFNAHLDIDSCDGKAWIGLKLQLGSATQQHLNVGGSSTYKDRRKMKSYASRKTVSNVNNGSTATTDMVVYDLPAEEA